LLSHKLHPTALDERRDLVVPGDNIATLSFAADHFISVANEAVDQHGFFAVALSGGSTPKALFERLCHPPYESQLPWKKIHLFWSDERAVPPSDPESNYHMAMEAGFNKMPIPSSQIHRMIAENEIQKNAEEYEKTIKDVLKDKPFELVMLGMGDDGHTASLFPNTEGLNISDRLVIANFIPQKNTWRMTMTFTCINQASHIAIYALGASKKFMLAKVLLSKTEEFPAQRVGSKEHKALWIADEAAADLVLSEKQTKK
jgi:6-phosphogluconolactonase